MQVYSGRHFNIYTMHDSSIMRLFKQQLAIHPHNEKKVLFALYLYIHQRGLKIIIRDCQRVACDYSSLYHIHIVCLFRSNMIVEPYMIFHAETFHAEFAERKNVCIFRPRLARTCARAFFNNRLYLSTSLSLFVCS